MEELTHRQKKALKFIRWFIETRGYAPTVRELAEAMGIVGPSNGAYYMDILERKSYIVRAKGKSRALRVIRDNGNSESAS